MTDITKKGVLLLDDDKFLVEMYGAKFAAAGFSVQISLSAKDALDVLRGGLKPSVILFDLTMPEMDGLTFLKTLSESKLAGESLKVALTNQSDDTEKAKVLELGVADYIVKASMIPSEVVNKVNALLGGATVKG